MDSHIRRTGKQSSNRHFEVKYLKIITSGCFFCTCSFWSFFLVFHCQLLVLKPLIPHNTLLFYVLHLCGTIISLTSCSRTLLEEAQETSFPSRTPESLLPPSPEPYTSSWALSHSILYVSHTFQWYILVCIRIWWCSLCIRLFCHIVYVI